GPRVPLNGARKAPYRPVVLCVLDGWGIAPDSPSNAVTRARTPRLRALFETYPHATLRASGRDVGLPDGVMGNSEVGHLTMGAGYIQYQEVVRSTDRDCARSLLRDGPRQAMGSRRALVPRDRQCRRAARRDRGGGAPRVLREAGVPRRASRAARRRIGRADG